MGFIIGWRGGLGSRLAERLAAAELSVARGGALRCSAAVVAEASTNPVPREARWLWYPPRAVSAEARAAAVLAGAYDVIAASEPDAEARLIERLVELAGPPEDPAIDQTDPGARVVGPAAPAGPWIGDGPDTERVRAQIARAARTSMPALITGEPGSGHEHAARLVHAWSPRRRARFVPVDCAAIAGEQMEAELFGDATSSGWLRAAEGGTVLLDGIERAPRLTQAKLLRVLEDRAVTPRGEREPHHTYFRCLAATHVDLRAACAAGAFEAALQERLAIVSIELPPLRARVDELPQLASHVVEQYYALEEADTTERVRGLSAPALAALAAYPWPGNLRELRNVLFAALVDKRRGDELLLSDLPRHVVAHGVREAPVGSWSRAAIERAMDAGQFNLREELEGLERAAVEAALERGGGSPARAAKWLGEVGRGRATDPAGAVRTVMRRLGVEA